MKQSISKITQNYNNFALIPDAHLGILLNHEPNHQKPSKCGASGRFKKTSNYDASESLILRFSRQNSACRLLKDKRVNGCFRYRLSEYVKVLKSPKYNKCHFGDLTICGSIWDCPVCSTKISQRRRNELSLVVDQHNKNTSGDVLLVTFTYPHQREDVLEDLLKKQSKASAWFYRHRTYKEIKSRYMKVGRVRALEITHGEKNGWHPHIHELWFLKVHLHDYETIEQELFDLWVRACKYAGLGEPSREHGVDVRGGTNAADYISKYGHEPKKNSNWGIEDEVTKANLKKGRNGSLTPFQLLDDYKEGNKQSGVLFIEYSKAFHGKRQIVWSRGFKALFNLEEKTDDEIAREEEEEAFTFAKIFGKDWDKSLRSRSDIRANILLLGENSDDPSGIERYIQGLVEEYKKMN